MPPAIRTPAGSAPVIPLVILGTGLYLTWFGVHYWRSDQKYPTSPLKDVLQGRPLPAASPPVPYAAQLTADVTALTPDAGGAAAAAAGSPGGGTEGTSAGGTYDHAQLVALWTGNGGSAGTANNAACHAMQESGGNASVTSPNPDGGTNVGLWQLDTKGEGAGYTVEQLKDPATNARITIMKTANGTSWGSWATPGC